MSTTFDMSSVLSAIQAMEAQLSALKAQLAAPAPAAAAAAPAKKTKKERKTSDVAREPSPWLVFTNRVRSLLKENGYSGKAVSTDCAQFCSSLVAANPDLSAWTDADILSRRSAWTKPEVSKQNLAISSRTVKKIKIPVSDDEEKDGGAVSALPALPASPVSPAAPAAAAVSVSSSVKAKKARKPRVSASSDEEKDASALPAPASSASVVSATSSVKEKKARKVKSAAAVALPASPKYAPAPVSPDVASLRKIILNGNRYLVHFDTGYTWYFSEDANGKPAKGKWAGIFSAPSVNEDGKRIPAKIDSSIPDPTAY